MTIRHYGFIGLLALLACSDATSPRVTPPDGTLRLSKLRGDNQTATVTAQLPQALVVEVKTGAIAASGIVVNFVALQGEVWAGTALTDANGQASDYWTLGSLAGPQWLEVRATNAAGDRIVYDTFFAVATPGPVTQLLLSTQDTTLFEREKFAVIPTLQAWDGYGNVVTDFGVHLTADSPFRISADTVWAEQEVKDFVGIAVGAADTAIYVGIIHDLSQYTWTGEFTCYDNPNAMRGSEYPPIGVDSMRSSFTVESTIYNSHSNGSAELYMAGPGRMQTWWKDGVYWDNVSAFGEYLTQVPADTLRGSLGIGLKAQGTPPRYEFPPPCNHAYQGGGTILILVGHE